MASAKYGLLDPDGPDYSQNEAGEILHANPETLLAWRKRGIGPPFYRNGRKHSRVWYPRQELLAWHRERVFASEAEAEATGR
jgi:hypothetical protein